ncbi:hypothetical protein FIBSPDRAFT_388826 [Athelia psychrophila]|uniref:Uncharacterized protein n=1 Tax=Athelia psychrophila TaxID=1759441 RepID=A0A166NTT4_9AGAM|nr:hypothetical protein FIBSPDRAFT_388826 [Fibularhizoctonia sp. CBS 109695]
MSHLRHYQRHIFRSASCRVCTSASHKVQVLQKKVGSNNGCFARNATRPFLLADPLIERNRATDNSSLKLLPPRGNLLHRSLSGDMTTAVADLVTATVRVRLDSAVIQALFHDCVRVIHFICHNSSCTTLRLVRPFLPPSPLSVISYRRRRGSSLDRASVPATQHPHGSTTITMALR